MIIQTRFANRNYARTLRQLAQRRYDVVPRFPDIRWMNPDDREDVRISFSAKSIARRLLAIDVPMVRMRVTPASVARRKHVVEVGREIGVIEVGVGFD